MLKITAIGNLTNDITLRTSESGKPVAILRIASDRRYRDRSGNRLTDFPPAWMSHQGFGGGNFVPPEGRG